MAFTKVVKSAVTNSLVNVTFGSSKKVVLTKNRVKQVKWNQLIKTEENSC